MGTCKSSFDWEETAVTSGQRTGVTLGEGRAGLGALYSSLPLPPQSTTNWVLHVMEIHSLMVLEATRARSRCWQGSRDGSFPPLPSFWGWPPSLACGRISTHHNPAAFSTHLHMVSPLHGCLCVPTLPETPIILSWGPALL